MAKQKGSDGQIRKTTAEWAADTSTYPEGMRLMDTETGVVRVSKGTTYALAWVPSSGGGGGQVNTVAWTDQYGVYLTVDSGTPSAPVFEPVGTESIIKTIAQIGHGLTLGQPVRMNGGAYVAAQGNSAANAAYVGFVLEVVSANQFRLLVAGHSAGAPAAMFSGLTAGTDAYLSPSSAGALTNTPNAFGPVLMPTSATAGYVLSNADSVALFTSPANTRANLGLPNVYTGILNQAGTDAPVATFETNQLGSVNFTYIDVGEYRLNGTGLFPAGTKVFIGNSVTAIVLASRDTDNRVVIYSQDHAGSPADDLLINASIRVEVWP